MTPELKQIAKTINELAKREEDARLELCQALAAAQHLVRTTTNLSWREWADQNLRRPDGSKWAMWTLYKYVSYGRDPEKLVKSRETIASVGRKARQALSYTRSEAVTTVSVHRLSGIDLERQIEALMFAWRNASAEARTIFLERITKDKAAA